MQTTVDQTTPETYIQTDFSSLLYDLGITYTASEYYWQVGEIKSHQGWIIHLSVIRVQLMELLNLVIPFLLGENVSFKIVRDIETAQRLLDGNLGYKNLGKLISICAGNDQQAADLATKLIELTESFRGPAIPTDRHLGNIVYTRFGSFNPILLSRPDGVVIKCLYNHADQLVEDPCPIPFQLPKGVPWPYSSIADPKVYDPGKLLNARYYPVRTLKPDVKGAVLKAFYFQSFWKIRSCLIKQGIQNMFADENGRDIRDRLQWQRDLHNALLGYVSMPRVFDYFELGGNSYLVMEYIHGISLMKWIHNIHQYTCWEDLSTGSQLDLLDKLGTVIDLTHRLHQKGYVHRDLNPENIMIDKHERLFLIDMELSWSLKEARPEPPFQLGSPGYTSPEQFRSERPTVKEDIFALGGFILSFFTTLHPTKLINQSVRRLTESISFFTGSPAISRIIISCQRENPEDRPSLIAIKNSVDQFKNEIKESETGARTAYVPPSLNPETLEYVVCAGLSGIVHGSMVDFRNLWTSKIIKKEADIGNEQFELDVYRGWHTGIAGPLWLLARAESCGFSSKESRALYERNWEYLHEEFFGQSMPRPGGLYMGGAGIALALAEGLNSNLLIHNNENISRLKECFSENVPGWDLPNGSAGQGMALLSCSTWLDDTFAKSLRNTLIENLFKNQNKDGSWNISMAFPSKEDTNFQNTSKVAGIILFLLTAMDANSGFNTNKPVRKALDWLIKRETNEKKLGRNPFDGQRSLTILTMIKAYKTLKEPIYREIAEAQIESIPLHPIRADFSLDSGLAGLGELMLEAYMAFNSDVFLKRAEWIAQIFIHAMQNRQDNVGFWITDTNTIPTADLFKGNGGIIHFLIRYLAPGVLSHPLLAAYRNKR
jgi:serine/threonine protein kinase